MIGPAAGTASRFAGTAASGSGPKSAMLTGATPSWAATVTDRGARSQTGPGRRSASGAASTTIPAVAPTDSHHPTEWTSSGSARSTMVTVRPRMRVGRDGRPLTTAVAAKAAITDALRTDGSKRVSTANQPINAMVTAQRVRAVRRRSTGE